MLRWWGLALVACTGSTTPTDDTGMPTVTGVTAETGKTTYTPYETPPDAPVLVVPYRQGIDLMAMDGTVVWSRTWSQMVGPCGGCGGEGASLDGDGMLVSFTTGRTKGLPLGGIARLDATGSLDFRVDGFGFPHDAIRDPADGTIIVTETSTNRLTWIDGNGGSGDPLRVLGTGDIRFGGQPNGADRFEYQDRTYLLLSHRRTGADTLSLGGMLTLWDITTAGEPAFVWRFPEKGIIDTPHGPVFRIVDDVWWLLWAHTGGAEGPGGTIGLGATDDPTVRPTYVADLTPGTQTGTLGFVRGVDLTEQGRLLITDTGRLAGGPVGRVLAATWPDLPIPENPRSGAIGDQTFVPLGRTEVLLDGIDNAYEGWLWDGRFLADDPTTQK